MQDNLFGFEEPWKDEWKGMPEFVQQDLAPFKSIYVHFESYEDAQKFAALVGQTITTQTRSIWYPEAEIGRIANKRWVEADAAIEAAPKEGVEIDYVEYQEEDLRG